MIAEDAKILAPTSVTTRPTTVLRTLRELRLDRGWTLTHLAGLTGINKGTLSQIERGRIVADNDELYSLGLALGARLDNRTVPCTEMPA